MTHAHTSAARALAETLTLEQQVGLLLHPIIILDEAGDPDASSGFGGPTLRQLIEDYGIRFFCLGSIPDPASTAKVLARLQDIARGSGSRLPLVFSTDPRHSFMQNDGAAHRAAGVSQWPENLGLGAIGDTELVRTYADILRKDYLAMGIRMALHPQVDLSTEPRWARQAQSFGADPARTTELLLAFLEGLQGPALGPEGIAATVKHFPGGGPQLAGEDPHFPYGREQVYPGGRFEEHLAPFRAAIEAGAAAIMPYYGMPIDLTVDGEPIEPVGFAFNRQIITNLLREKLGYDGVVLSDFGLVTDIEIAGKPFPACAWGVEHLSPLERVGRLFNAGVDQLGGELDAPLILRAVAEGLVSPERVKVSATRLVKMMLDLGLIDNETDTRTSAALLPLPQDVSLGKQAQARAVTVLTNGSDDLPVLPLAGPRKVHLVNLSEEALPAGWSAVDADTAEVAIVRVSAPYEHRDRYFLEAGMQQGSLDFPEEEVQRIAALGRRLPTILVVTLNRPAILTPLVDAVDALLVEFGIADDVLLEVLTGVRAAEGQLPFELPRSMAAVEASNPDVANDTADPLFPAGWGLSLSSRNPKLSKAGAQ
ncbi:glycoside hydrolase family 3 N-terminal domain-containing protein [Arthrobacter sp. NicSoilB11]|uniref:glycoside hydrolase family 3 protein n=1 Tax=Micrococcaceae TaxID=1268 RepID=UPI001CC3F876|nr:glycoside hydrolase family 3 N-terminal domain-containing protein [Arthrobacter sp. NicSoilB11]BCW77916.1 beta-glucosidase [Arthrobacter sp. NicSoilB11]